MRFFVPVLFCCLPLFAQTAGRRVAPANGVAANPTAAIPAAVKPEDKCTVEGTVVNSVSGEPLKKAQLSLRPMGVQNGIPYGATTDGAGHFLIDDVDPGRYNFNASRNGYVGQGYSPQGNAHGNATLTLDKGQKLKQIVFKLTPQGVISGRILDEDGEPLANVMIQPMAFAYQRGKRQLMQQGGANTDDRGEFRLHGLRPGKYVISASYRAQGMFGPVVGPAQDSDESYATTYYPSGTNPERASQIEITPGAQVSGINMTLMPTRTVRIKGHVNIGVATQTRRNVNLMLMPRDTPAFMMMPRNVSRVIDGQGNFQMRGVLPGSYTLRADFADDNKRYSARLPIEVGSTNIDGIELSLTPAGEIQGRVVVEDNGDLGGANLNIFLQPKISGPNMGGGNAQLSKDLTFKLQNVGPDPYDINVFGLPEGFYLKSIRLGEQDVTETGVDFSQGVSAAQLTVVINPNGGQIEGAAQNAKDQLAPGATVTLIPEESHQSLSWLYKTANTDQNGHFTMKGVRPGKYKIYAWEDIEPGAYQDPDFVKPHESKGEKVEIKEGSHETVQLKAVPAENTSSGQSPTRN